MRLLVYLLQQGYDVDLMGTGQKKSRKFWWQHKYSLFFLRPCCLLIFSLQQQITEAVLKIKVLFSCSCKKTTKKQTKTRSAQNLNDSTKRSVNMPCKWWVRDITVGKIYFAFFNNENILIFLHFRIISHNLKLYIYICIYKKMKEMNKFFVFWIFFWGFL